MPPQTRRLRLAQNRPMDTARVIQVIETTLTKRGTGNTRRDPIRVVTQYWSLDGILLVESDPFSGAVLREDYVEDVARAIYEAMPCDIGEKPSWVAGGNSHKQSEARQRARTALNL